MTSEGNIVIQNIFHMLSYAFKELNMGQYRSIGSEAFDNIHDLFAEIMYRGISSQLKQGLHRSYVEVSEELPTLRGRLNLQESLKLKCRGNAHLSCDFDNFSEDNIFNRILSATINKLLSDRRVKPQRKMALKSIRPYFEGLRPIDLNLVRWDTLTFDRNSRRYQMLISFCYMLHEKQIVATDTDRIKGADFTDDQKLHRLFEKFILEYYRRHYPELNPSASQIEWNLVHEESPAANILPVLQTDTILTFENRKLILDAKFYNKTMQKNFGKSTIHSHNQHQIFTYVMNLDREHKGNVDGMLIYAGTGEEIVPDRHITLADGNRIYYRTLNLNQNFDAIRQQLDSIIELGRS